MTRFLRFLLSFLLIWAGSQPAGQLAAAAPFAQAPGFYLPPEYAATRAVLVSEIILADENGYRLIQALLQARTEVWFLSDSVAGYDDMLSHLHQVYGLRAPDLARIRQLPVKTQSLWARDWAPLMTLPSQPQTAQQTLLRMLDTRYLPQRPLDDSVPAQIGRFLQAQSPSHWRFQAVAVPLALEGGNIMCTQSDCVLSDEVLIQNPPAFPGQSGGPDRINSVLAQHLDQRVSIVPRLPLESTGHLDMWAKFLDEKTLVIAEVPEQALKLVPRSLRQAYAEIRDFLEAQASGYDRGGQTLPNALASQLRQRIPGLKIKRVPMPVPYADGHAAVFRSYTNSLLVNGHAILPRYVRDGYGRPYPDQRLLKDYEASVQQVYEQAGFRVSWIDADYLILSGGAWHCATMQVPGES